VNYIEALKLNKDHETTYKLFGDEIVVKFRVAMKSERDDLLRLASILKQEIPHPGLRRRKFIDHVLSAHVTYIETPNFSFSPYAEYKKGSPGVVEPPTRWVDSLDDYLYNILIDLFKRFQQELKFSREGFGPAKSFEQKIARDYKRKKGEG
jgi:hypothetical protein